ncbi:hypothetical protein JTB14_009217 [Gonioctena quinquepunctata]|nr:hypothetical protein JTB14_009217 [Gonioctena quinquepunctata]
MLTKTEFNATYKGWELEKNNILELKSFEGPQLPHLVRDVVFEREADDDEDDEIYESESDGNVENVENDNNEDYENYSSN